MDVDDDDDDDDDDVDVDIENDIDVDFENDIDVNDDVDVNEDVNDGGYSSSLSRQLRPLWSPERLQREPSSLLTSSTGNRLRRWSFFQAMRWRCFFFLLRCDIDYFWRYPTITIGAIIFPNNRDRLFYDVFSNF